MIYIHLLPTRLAPLANDFRREISAHHKDIDPYDEYEWFSLAFGFALAKGISPEDADAFAIYARQHDFFLI
jgi:hypothetical protein